MEQVKLFIHTAWHWIGRTGKSAIETPARRISFAILLGGFLLFGAVAFMLSAPADFPERYVVEIEEGATLSEVARVLAAEDIIRSPVLFRVLVSLTSAEHAVIAGDYFFMEPKGAFTVARMITTGDYGLTPIAVRIPEGASIVDIAGVLAEEFNAFNPQEFIEQAHGKEGYLFPDTYYFLPNVNAEKVLSMLEDTFAEKIQPYRKRISRSPHTMNEILTMASIIEREANSSESRRLISGVLWNRIEIGMPLQVDVTFSYINGKNTFELTDADLAIDSPYNTYKYPGLPPGPIGNPGLDSIIAALEPEETDFLYFLADLEGEVHYSVTFEEHVEKKLKYLR